MTTENQQHSGVEKAVEAAAKVLHSRSHPGEAWAAADSMRREQFRRDVAAIQPFLVQPSHHDRLGELRELAEDDRFVTSLQANMDGGPSRGPEAVPPNPADVRATQETIESFLSFAVESGALDDFAASSQPQLSDEDRERFLALKRRLFSEEPTQAGAEVFRRDLLGNEERSDEATVQRIVAAVWNAATGHGDFPLDSSQLQQQPECETCGDAKEIGEEIGSRGERWEPCPDCNPQQHGEVEDADA